MKNQKMDKIKWQHVVYQSIALKKNDDFTVLDGILWI